MNNFKTVNQKVLQSIVRDLQKGNPARAIALLQAIQNDKRFLFAMQKSFLEAMGQPIQDNVAIINTKKGSFLVTFSKPVYDIMDSVEEVQDIVVDGRNNFLQEVLKQDYVIDAESIDIFDNIE